MVMKSFDAPDNSQRSHFERIAVECRPTNEILTAKEVAQELRCSRTQVYRLLNGAVKDVPKLPYISLGRKKVIRRSSFEDWKQTNESIILAATQEMNTDGRMN